MGPTLISVQVGVPRKVLRDGEEVLTGIFKTPVKNRIRMSTLNLEGDRQADLSVHGGSKALSVSETASRLAPRK